MPSNPHIVTSFEDELRALDNKLAEMGGLAERLAARDHADGHRFEFGFVLVDHPVAGDGLFGKRGVALIEGFERLLHQPCLLYTSPSPRDRTRSRMPSSA